MLEERSWMKRNSVYFNQLESCLHDSNVILYVFTSRFAHTISIPTLTQYWDKLMCYRQDSSLYQTSRYVQLQLLFRRWLKSIHQSQLSDFLYKEGQTLARIFLFISNLQVLNSRDFFLMLIEAKFSLLL